MHLNSRKRGDKDSDLKRGYFFRKDNELNEMWLNWPIIKFEEKGALSFK